MSIAAEEKTIVSDIRGGVENAFDWLKQVVETHLPQAEADYNGVVTELKRLQSSPVTQAVESAVLTPAEEEWVAGMIAKLPALRVKPAGEATSAEGNGEAPDAAAA